MNVNWKIRWIQECLSVGICLGLMGCVSTGEVLPPPSMDIFPTTAIIILESYGGLRMENSTLMIGRYGAVQCTVRSKEHRGSKVVEIVTQKRGKLTEQELADLLKVFEDNRFWTFDDSYRCVGGRTDRSNSKITHESKTVLDQGCGPAELGPIYMALRDVEASLLPVN